MRILFITDLYPVKNDEKATPKALYNFVKEWEKDGHTVDVIKPNYILNSFWRGKPFYKTGKYGKVININYWTPFWFNVKKKLNNLAFKNFDIANYDLVIAHMPSGILFANKLGMPFVAGVHNSDLKVLKKPIYRLFKKNHLNALKNAKAIACRSYVVKDKLLKLYPEFEKKAFVAPSGVDEDIITNNIHPFDFSKIKILTCANLKKRKNINKLILACKDIKNVELTVIGDGKIKKSLEKLDNKVIFKGYMESKDVFCEMDKNQVFILPSVVETFGLVYLEAMARGCITVCTKNDGIDGIIKDGENGFLTEPTVEGIKKIISKIKNLDVNTLESIKNNAYKTVVELTSSKCAQNYLQQIFKIL